jgi:undecaprenyl-diphosphatase
MSVIDLDYQLFKLINDLAGTAAFFNPIMRFLSLDAEYLFYIGIIVYWFTRTNQNRRMVATALFSACIGLGISGLLAHFFYRDRPFIAHPVFQLIKHPANASFPSDHATGAFVIAVAIWLFHKKIGRVWIFLAACIAFSRIWTGVHYPTDIIAGALIGTISAWAVHRLFAHWILAQRLLDAILNLYERLEQTVWKKKLNNRSFD